MIKIDLIRFNEDREKFLKALPYLKRLGYKFDMDRAKKLDLKGINLIQLNEDGSIELSSHKLSMNEISVEMLEKFKWFRDESEDNRAIQIYNAARTMGFDEGVEFIRKNLT